MSYLQVFPRQEAKKNSPQGKKQNIDEKTTVIIGRAIKKLSPTQDCLQNFDSYTGNCQRKWVLPRQHSKK